MIKYKNIRDSKSFADMASIHPHMLLANEIVLRAIEEWKSLCRGAQECASVNFGELRGFFKSEYCDLLLHGTGLTGEYILTELEDLKEAMRYGTSQKTWQKRRKAER